MVERVLLDAEHSLIEFKAPGSLVNQPVTDLARYDVTAVLIHRTDRLIPCPGADTRLEAGDTLFVAGARSSWRLHPCYDAGREWRLQRRSADREGFRPAPQAPRTGPDPVGGRPGGLIGIGTAALLLPGMTRTPSPSWMRCSLRPRPRPSRGWPSCPQHRLRGPRQWVILLLMQVGGLGFLVTLVLPVRLLLFRVSLMDRLAVNSSLGLAGTQAILQILSRTVIFMLAVEGTGALILWGNWRWRDIVPEGRAFYALFHAVAAFCNAGFDLFYGLPLYPEGLPADRVSLMTLGTLVIIGGLGIPVYIELLNRRSARRDRRGRPLEPAGAAGSLVGDPPDCGGMGRAADWRIPALRGPSGAAAGGAAAAGMVPSVAARRPVPGLR